MHNRLTGWPLIVICLVFLTLRLPVMFLQPGGQDEECYAVPGLTVLRTGIPSLPHIPARNLDSVFYRADEVLYAEPPLFFYYQALFYLIFPAAYGTARLASAMAGILLLCLVHRLAGESGVSRSASLWTVALLSLSRWFYFPATSARPDILCAAFGIAMVLMLMHWHRTGHTRQLVFAGVCIGLGGLTHPFALIYAVQAAAWAVIHSRGWKRLGNPLILAGVAMLCCSLWLPMIMMSPDVFAVQFRNQFLSDAGTPIWQRAIFPLESIRFHLSHLQMHIGNLQLVPGLLGLLIASVIGWRTADIGLRITCALAWSSFYLLCVVVGTHHPVHGYWVYFAALIFPCLGLLPDRVRAAVHSRANHEESAAGRLSPWPLWSSGLVMLLGLLIMIPGSGLRSVAVYVRHWQDSDFNAPRFARELLKELPEDQVYAVDTQFVLDFVAAGRRTIWAQTHAQFFRLQDFDFDVAIISRSGIDTDLAERMNLRRTGSRGRQENKWACYVEIYVPPEQ